MGKILIFKADERQIYLNEELKKRAYDTLLINNRKEAEKYLGECFAVILPLPGVKDGKINSFDMTVWEFVRLTGKDTLVFSGCTQNSELEKLLSEKGIKLIDYFKREELAFSNACATAQGILKLILNEIKTLCSENSILISGFGKTGKALCGILSKNGFSVNVLVRQRKYLPEIAFTGGKGFLYSEFKGGEYSFLINTVPAPVIDGEILQKINRDCKLLEISSAPYGIDFEKSAEYGFHTRILPSVPGRDVPRFAGKAIANAVDNIIKEENLWKK